MTQKPLMKYRCAISHDGKTINTWGVYPIAGGTKIIDGIYDPTVKALKLAFDSVTQQMMQVPIQDPKSMKVTLENRKVDEYYKGLISNENDIEFFLKNYVENDFEYIYEEPKLIIENV